jgi:hypothetical protein
MGIRIMLWALFTIVAGAVSADEHVQYVNTSYCDLVQNPERYSGQRVSFTATYRYGYEWQEIYCLTCRDTGKTWLEFPQDPPKEMKKAVKGTPKGQGTLNANFKGVFQTKPGSFGDGSYKYQLALEHIADVHVLSRSGGVAGVLPEPERRRVCGGATAPR